MDEYLTVAHIVAGEAMGCPVIAMVAVAYVYSRNKTMYGYSDYLPPEAIFAAQYWSELPDPTFGATFLFSASDLKQDRVQRIIHPANAPPLVRTNSFDCGYSSIHSYAKFPYNPNDLSVGNVNDIISSRYYGDTIEVSTVSIVEEVVVEENQKPSTERVSDDENITSKFDVAFEERKVLPYYSGDIIKMWIFRKGDSFSR